MHPWEDWAETWAHYMHVVDSLGTAVGYGVNLERNEGRVQPFGEDALYDPGDPYAERFLGLLNAWLRMTHALERTGAQPGPARFLSLRDVQAGGGQAAVRADGRGGRADEPGAMTWTSLPAPPT
jgi:hypothetical protein